MNVRQTGRYTERQADRQSDRMTVWENIRANKEPAAVTVTREFTELITN